jgi:hypothetical protein
MSFSNKDNRNSLLLLLMAFIPIFAIYSTKIEIPKNNIFKKKIEKDYNFDVILNNIEKLIKEKNIPIEIATKYEIYKVRHANKKCILTILDNKYYFAMYTKNNITKLILLGTNTKINLDEDKKVIDEIIEEIKKNEQVVEEIKKNEQVVEEIKNNEQVVEEIKNNETIEENNNETCAIKIING